MADSDIKRIIEAILFSADTPVSLDRLVDVIPEAARGKIRSTLGELADDYTREGRSFALSEVGGGWQLYVRPQFAKWAKELYKGRIPPRLSQASLETLAMVAYKQPIVRAEIEAIRGVDSSGVLATLLRRGVIRIVGRAPGMGRALMYGTTKEFLRYFGLNSITDLPRLEEFAEVLGLKPDELEMTIKGAEAFTELEASREMASAVESDEVIGDEPPTRFTPLPLVPATEAEEEPDASSAHEAEDAQEPASSVVEDGRIRHPVGDRKLLNTIDET